MKFKLLIGLASLSAYLAFQSFNAHGAGSLSGNPASVHKRFNTEARKLKTGHRMVLRKCSRGKAKICNYRATGRLEIIAASPKNRHGKLASVTVIYGRGSKPKDMLILIGILMITYSPNSDQQERMQAILSLSEILGSGKDRAKVALGKTTYTMANFKSLGIWFIVEPL